MTSWSPPASQAEERRNGCGGRAPQRPELPIQFHEDRWICHLPPLVSLERQLSIQLAEGLPIPSSEANLAKLQAEERQSLFRVGELKNVGWVDSLAINRRARQQTLCFLDAAARARQSRADRVP